MKSTYIILLLLLVQLIVVGLAYGATSPQIHYVKINGTSVSPGGTVDVTMKLPGSFRIKIKVKNGGDDSPAFYNNITFSFPQFTSSSDKSRVWYSSKSSDLDYTEYFGNEPDGGDKYAEYVMVESIDTNGWDGSDYFTTESNYIELKVQPKGYGAFYVYYRIAMSNQKSWTSGWTYLPSSSRYKDCLGFPAYRVTLNIVEPNVGPTITMYSPKSNVKVEQGQIVTISWNGADPDDEATVNLARDSDTNFDNEGYTWIALGQPEDGSYDWDTRDVPRGKYYILGFITDGKGSGYDYAEGEVEVIIPYLLKVRGGFKYQPNTQGAPAEPIRDATVVLQKKTGGIFRTIETTNTNSGGEYTFSTKVASGDEIRVRIRSGTAGVKVVDPRSDSLFEYDDTDYSDASGFREMGIKVIPTADGGAWNIYECILAGYEFLQDKLGMSPSKIGRITVKWYLGYLPEHKTTYFDGADEIHVLGTTDDPDQWDDPVLLHEYGHYIAQKVWSDPSPGGRHSWVFPNSFARGLGDPLGWGELSSEQQQRLAFSEGWATFYAALVMKEEELGDEVYIDQRGLKDEYTRFRVINPETGHSWQKGTTLKNDAMYDWWNDKGEHYSIIGNTSEAAVVGILWDIYDRDDGKDYYWGGDGPEPYTDMNGNGQWDLGEPYTDTNGNGKYDPAYLFHFFTDPYGNFVSTDACAYEEAFQDIWTVLKIGKPSTIEEFWSLWNDNNIGTTTSVQRRKAHAEEVRWILQTKGIIEQVTRDYTFQTADNLSQIKIDGTWYNSPMTFQWKDDTSHTVQVSSIWPVSDDTRYSLTIHVINLRIGAKRARAQTPLSPFTPA